VRTPDLRPPRLLAHSFAAALWAVLALAQTPSTTEAAFLTENRAAMEKMMVGMSVKATGDVDEDFAAMMIPHHQGAIEMARSELRHGRNEQLRRIAQEIIIEQQQEIVAMRLAVKPPLPAAAASPRQSASDAASPKMR
jgi:uncharacterized protein (DUF305 family)